MKKLIIASFTLLLLASCGTASDENSGESDIDAFSYTNQNDETFSSDQLQGKTWVANFIFTNCERVCPPMTSNMSRLQSLLAENNIDAELVSFSVDPTNDTPQILKQFAEDRGAQFDNWNLLTGYSDDEIKQLAKESFSTLVENPENSDQVLHSNKFFIVSPNGKVVDNYNGTQADNMQKIVDKIQSIQ
ncbi:SCO1 protein-like protein [Gracilibacillus halophilus YIM-C55.5]|uniref:SCO1 protein-like protein n=1 Tax=Gracilibacillus halophilus YIM-C55.5 TaxID=1308866 RepID=N4WM09_9BACI|nr:SCO family protein [Gracilibacillus halophilus]ENH97202.1 SCO1 protein-like protein [Gracilibacillus halophilus YIM-C55.5]